MNWMHLRENWRRPRKQVEEKMEGSGWQRDSGSCCTFAMDSIVSKARETISQQVSSLDEIELLWDPFGHLEVFGLLSEELVRPE
mmetsp:Transcript_1006/g.3461  ORF Transcript_1006/g.3461 Transcript_1006/m.3461 type:complete len:84 (-) Transcript_1006:604-855(-)